MDFLYNFYMARLTYYMHFALDLKIKCIECKVNLGRTL